MTLWFAELQGELRVLEAYFGKDLNETQMEMYMKELRGFDKFQLKNAVVRICKDRKPTPGQFPTPGEISGLMSGYVGQRTTTTSEDMSPLVAAARRLEATGIIDHEQYPFKRFMKENPDLGHTDAKRVYDRHFWRFKMVPKISDQGLSYFALYRKPAKGGEWQQIHAGQKAVERLRFPAQGDLNYEKGVTNA